MKWVGHKRGPNEMKKGRTCPSLAWGGGWMGEAEKCKIQPNKKQIFITSTPGNRNKGKGNGAGLA